MAINKKGMVVPAESIKNIIIKIISDRNCDVTVNDIMQDLRDIYRKKPARKYVIWVIHHLVHENKIIRLKKGAGQYNPAIFIKKGKENEAV